MKIYNTSSRKEEEIKEKDVKMVICGPTLYDYMHLGHARLFVLLDVFARYLRYEGYKPLMLVVLTDIDPKIFKRAKELNIDYKEFIDRYKREFIYDFSLLNIDLRNIIFASASDYLAQAHNNILQLIDKGYAYVNRSNVYFDITRIKDYGYLSEFRLKAVDLIEGKRSLYDFMLWNGREEFPNYIKSNLLGKGLPWWHIQDVSIALSNFNIYTLHAGATELIYPHHEAQRAILRVFNKEPKFWFHINLLTINGEKMGKSKNNTILVRDAILRYGLNTLRVYLLSKDYREEMEFREDDINIFHRKVKEIGYGGSDIEMNNLNSKEVVNKIEYIKSSILKDVIGLKI